MLAMQKLRFWQFCEVAGFWPTRRSYDLGLYDVEQAHYQEFSFTVIRK